MFETNRLVLRAVDEAADLNLLLQCNSDPNFRSLVSSGPVLPASRDEAKEWLKPRPPGSLPKIAICEKPTGDGAWPEKFNPLDDHARNLLPAIGFINFNPKQFDFKTRIAWIGLGFLDKEHRGKGYGREVLEWALEYAFMELGLHRVSLEVYSFNEGAIKLYRNVGFVEEGRQRKTCFKGGVWYDSILMAVLEEEWLELRAKLPSKAHPN